MTGLASSSWYHSHMARVRASEGSNLRKRVINHQSSRRRNNDRLSKQRCTIEVTEPWLLPNSSDTGMDGWMAMINTPSSRGVCLVASPTPYQARCGLYRLRLRPRRRLYRSPISKTSNLGRGYWDRLQLTSTSSASPVERSSCFRSSCCWNL